MFLTLCSYFLAKAETRGRGFVMEYVGQTLGKCNLALLFGLTEDTVTHARQHPCVGSCKGRSLNNAHLPK